VQLCLKRPGSSRSGSGEQPILCRTHVGVGPGFAADSHKLCEE
jgi:hypothetical protein